MVKIINGLEYATQIKSLIKRELQQQKEKPSLAIVQVGENPASQLYVASKKRQAKDLGIEATHYHFPESVSQDQLVELIQKLNLDSGTHGIIVQIPLPASFDVDMILEHIAPEKDVDGLTTTNTGRLSKGLQGYVPCTPLGCLFLLENEIGELKGLHAVVVGRSNLVGKPMAQVLLHQDCTVSVLHSKSINPEKIAKQADIIIAAAGKRGLVQESWVKEGAVILDVGINRTGDKIITGDLDLELSSTKAGAVSPVPGGVGPMTVACLLYNTTLAMFSQLNLPLTYLKTNPLKEPLCLSSTQISSKS